MLAKTPKEENEKRVEKKQKKTSLNSVRDLLKRNFFRQNVSFIAQAMHQDCTSVIAAWREEES